MLLGASGMPTPLPTIAATASLAPTSLPALTRPTGRQPSTMRSVGSSPPHMKCKVSGTLSATHQRCTSAVRCRSRHLPHGTRPRFPAGCWWYVCSGGSRWFCVCQSFNSSTCSSCGFGHHYVSSSLCKPSVRCSMPYRWATDRAIIYRLCTKRRQRTTAPALCTLCGSVCVWVGGGGGGGHGTRWRIAPPFKYEAKAVPVTCRSSLPPALSGICRASAN